MNVDSLLNQFMNVPADMARIFGDTAGIRIYTRAAGDPATIRMDTVHFLRPAEALTSGMVMGMRSVAGAELAELNPGLAEYFGAISGVLVIEARDGTPAEQAGIRAGDIITRVGETNVTSIAELRRAMAGGPPGRQIRLRVLRHGQPVDITLGG